MKKLMVVIILVLLCLQISFADIVYLNEGEEVIGKLHAISDEKITLIDFTGQKRDITTSEVAHILISKVREGDEIHSIASITDPIATGILRNRPDASLFAGANHVTLYRLYEYEYINDTQVNQHVREISQVLKEPALDNANQSFYYFTDREDFELKFAHTYSPDGTIHHVTDDAISDESLTPSTPEYSKLKRYKIAMKKVDIGSIIDFSYTMVLKDIGELSPFIIGNVFGEREPVLHEEIAITFPDGMDLRRVQMQWLEKDKPSFTEQKHDGKTTWKWIYSNPKGFIPEQSMMPIYRIFPRLFVYKPYDMDIVASKLADAYKKARPDDIFLDDLIKSAAIEKTDNDFAKVSRIYETINKEIREIGISPSDMGNYSPVSGNTTLSKKYGNAQARLAVMHFALEKIGISSFPGFTSSRQENVTIKDNPTLAKASSPVLKVIINGHEYFTDGGSAYVPFSIIRVSLQGAMAAFLDIENKNISYTILPKQTYEWNRFARTVMVKLLENGSMNVLESLNYYGPYEGSIRRLRSVKKKEQYNYAERRIKRVHPNAELKSFGFSNLDDLSAPVVLTLSYTIPQAAQVVSDKIITFTNFWVNYDSSSASLATRTYPMEYWATEENQRTVIFELPEGFDWVTWDRQYKSIFPEISFRSSLNQNGRSLVYCDRFVVNEDEFLSDSSYQNYRKTILTMSELANQWIIIEKKNKSEVIRPEPDVLPANIASPTENIASD